MRRATQGGVVEQDKLQDEKPKSMKRALLRNLIILVFVAGLITLLYYKYWRFHDQAQFVVKVLTHGTIQERLDNLRVWLQAWGPWGPLVSFFAMIFSSVVAPIPSLAVTLANGWVFGVFWGTMLSWSSAMVGAALCFGISRGFGRPAVERLVNKKVLSYVDNFSQRYGTNSILIARLVPVVPFDPVSYFAGLTPISFWRFFIATGIGQLPATIVYSWIGANVTAMASPGLWANVGLWVVPILAALIIIWFMVKKAMERRIDVKSGTAR